MSVYFAIPSARPPAEAGPRLAKWRAMGYKVAIWRDHPEAVPCDIELRGLYPGYYCAINALTREIFRVDSRAQWIVSGGDDMEPDPTHHPYRIAGECMDHFQGTLGVMQPTGDRWGVEGRIYAEQVAGSPWLGREWCRRAYGGFGPVFDEYRHYFGDEELQRIAQREGLFWQRSDLSHYHAHYMREQCVRPSFHKDASAVFARDRELFQERETLGFPESNLIA